MVSSLGMIPGFLTIHLLDVVSWLSREILYDTAGRNSLPSGLLDPHQLERTQDLSFGQSPGKHCGLRDGSGGLQVEALSQAPRKVERLLRIY